MIRTPQISEKFARRHALPGERFAVNKRRDAGFESVEKHPRGAGFESVKIYHEFRRLPGRAASRAADVRSAETIREVPGSNP